MILAVSDAVQVALIAGITAAAPAMLIAWLGYMKVLKSAKTVDVIHTLVNSQMGEQLRLGMVSAKTLASVKPSKANTQLALDAELKWRDHETKQAKVDAKA